MHPLAAAAAIAVIVFSAVGVAAITGLIPTSTGSSSTQTNDTGSALPAPPANERRARTADGESAKPAARTQARAQEAAPGPAPERSRVASAPPVAEPAPVCRECGTIESVREVSKPGEGSGLGAVAGGVAGGVLGRQIGGGSGRDIATVAGAVGGAVVGHQVEKRVKTSHSYEIVVRMDDGTTRTFASAEPPAVRIGDKVRTTGEGFVPAS